MTDDETADSIILKYSLLSGAADLNPVVGADLAGILACQLRMYYELADHYQVAVTKERFKDLALTLGGAVGGWGVTIFGATKMLKLVPGIGTFFLLWQPPLIAAFTWSMGQVLKTYFPAAKLGREWQHEDFRRAMRDAWKGAKRMDWPRRLRSAKGLARAEIPATLEQPIESLPYEERKMLVIIDDADDGQSSPPISTVLGLIIARRKWVANLKFVGARPEQNALYVGHPYRHDVYYIAPDFHRELCKDKALELIDLLRSLGASDVLLEEQEGFNCARDIQGDVGLASPVVGGELSVKRAARARSERSARRHFQFHGARRAETISMGVWYPYEEEWQSYVKWRDDGLSAFDLEYKYFNDFGVNTEAVGEVAKVLAMSRIGLKSAHATFKETVWRLKVQFADRE